MNQALFMSEKQNWETPQALFDRLNEEFHFTLDAAADDTNHKLPHYFTAETDGLKQDWGGATCVLQSSLRGQGNRLVDGEMLAGSAKTQHPCRVTHTGKDRPKIFS